VDKNNEPSLWPIHHVFYIQSMLFNTKLSLQAAERASKYIRAISDGKIGSQDRKDEILDCLQNFINHSAAIARYFFPSMIGGRSEKVVHKNRAEFLRKVFDVSENSPLHDKKLRNAIEHFDERLDIYLEGGIVGIIFPSLILDKPEETDVPHHIFRAYYLNEGVYQVLGEKYAVQHIFDEVLRIHELLEKFDENGGSFRK
jgi:hypothetical protein